MSVLFRDFAAKAAVPVTFLLALVPVALIAGRTASLVAAIVAGFIFAVYLFEPYGSLVVRSTVDQIELLCFGVGSLGVALFSPSPQPLAKKGTQDSSGHAPSYSSLQSRDTQKAAHQLETWIAAVGYAVVLTAIVTLLLYFWNSMRY
jgi:hypothetical protein